MKYLGYVAIASLLIFPSVSFPSVSLAQTGNASMTGTVRDPSGAFVPGVQVTIRSVATGVGRTTTTNSAGLYYVPNLIPGPYELKVQASGFETSTIGDIHLVIDQQARIDATLQVAKVGQAVLVTSAPPMLQAEEATVGTVISSQQVLDLPLNGRYYTVTGTGSRYCPPRFKTHETLFLRVRRLTNRF